MISKAKNGWSGMFAAGGIIVAAGLASGCSDSPPTGPPPTYTVGGTVSGLAGSGLVLRDNGGDDLPVSGNGPVIFATPVASGAAYSVTVFAQPLNPAQHCAVTTGSGTMASANVTTVAIVCATNTYTVGGMVSGLVGSGLVLRDNGRDDLPVSSNGPVTFATPVASGTAYSITVFTQPTSPPQSCVVTGGSGTLASANLTTVAIACATTYTVGGMVSGLTGTGLVLRNGGDDLAVSANGPVTFATPVASGAAYSVTVLTQPTRPAQTCVVTDGSGAMASADVTTVATLCVTNAGPGALRVTASTPGPDAPAIYAVYADRGTSGPSTAVVPANGTVSFELAPGAHTVGLTVAQNCIVTSPNPVPVTVATGAIADIAFSVTCVANGTVQITVATTGPDAPATYAVYADYGSSTYSAGDVPSNGTASLAVAPGSATVGLAVPPNCTVSGNARPVRVVSGSSTRIAFSVTCEPAATLRVTASTTGRNAPATYTVSWPAHDFSDRSVYAFISSSNGTVSKILTPGDYRVTLRVPLNCTVTSPNNGLVTLTSGATTHLGFTVACQ